MRGLWIAGVFVLLIAATGIVAANEAPMAEAGLDQEAIVNSTVYLDAGGSLDPDGEIVDYDWSIETPNGTVKTPDCPSCSLTEFVPRNNGTYAVTVTVTDDGGAVRSDTMYVEVGDTASESTPGAPPSDDVPGGAPINLNLPGSGGSESFGYTGGNADTAAFNSESNNLRLREANGGGIRLRGMVGGPHGQWMTADELDKLLKNGFATRADFDTDVILVTDDDLSRDLAETLQAGAEAIQPRYNDYQTTIGAAEEDPDRVLEEHGVTDSGSSAGSADSNWPTKEDLGNVNGATDTVGDPSNGDGDVVAAPPSSPISLDSTGPYDLDTSNLDVGYSGSSPSPSSNGIDVDTSDIDVDPDEVNIGPVNPSDCTGDDCIELNIGDNLI